MEFINYSNLSLGKEAIAVPIAIGRIETNFLVASRYNFREGQSKKSLEVTSKNDLLLKL
jgi:hypothetical protein